VCKRVGEVPATIPPILRRRRRRACEFSQEMRLTTIETAYTDDRTKALGTQGVSRYLLNVIRRRLQLSAEPRAAVTYPSTWNSVCGLTLGVSAPVASIPSNYRETKSMPKGAEQELMDKWKIADASEMYGIRNWGKGYFSINKSGHVIVQPNKR